MKTDQGPDETRPSALISVNDKLPYLGQWVMVELPRFAASVSLTPTVDGAMPMTITLLKTFGRGTPNSTAPQTPLASNPVHTTR